MSRVGLRETGHRAESAGQGATRGGLGRSVQATGQHGRCCRAAGNLCLTPPSQHNSSLDTHTVWTAVFPFISYKNRHQGGLTCGPRCADPPFERREGILHLATGGNGREMPVCGVGLVQQSI